jgi:hypothetical protein
MVRIDDTLEELGLLYQAVGGNENYEIWDDTFEQQGKMQKGLEEVVRALEEENGRESASRQRVIDYWDELEQQGLMDESWQPTELGRDWVRRTSSAVQSLYMSDADVAEDRKQLGDIFFTLGTEDALPVLHLLYQGDDLEENLDPSQVRHPVDVMYRQGFIQDEAYRNGVPGPDTDVLTERSETVYEEVVEPDYQWLRNQDFDVKGL